MKSTILIVDDTIENIEILDELLNEDYDIKVATNGPTALKIADKFKPSLILLDIMMPDMDGYEVCRRLKDNPKTSHIPVVFVTAMNEDEDEEKGLDLGAVDYLTKPIKPAIAKKRIHTQIILSDQKAALDLEVRNKTNDLIQSRVDLVQRLGKAAEYKDDHTGLHVIRVGKYSALIAEKMGLSKDEVEIISLASPMHDVGKIGIEDNILKKKGKLSSEEYEVIKGHSLYGVDILGEHSDKLLKTASIMAEQHHERWNGTGYPYGLKSDQIHLYARIVSVADVFDALTSKRHYKKAWDFKEAFEYIISRKGIDFDPDIINVFETIYDELLEIFNNNDGIGN